MFSKFCLKFFTFVGFPQIVDNVRRRDEFGYIEETHANTQKVNYRD